MAEGPIRPVPQRRNRTTRHQALVVFASIVVLAPEHVEGTVMLDINLAPVIESDLDLVGNSPRHRSLSL